MGEVSAKDPENASWRAFLAEALGNEGRTLLSMGRLAESLARHQRSLALREPLLAAGPEDPVAQADVADSLLELGRIRSRMGDDAAARAQWTRAAELLDQALKVSDRSVHRIRYARVLLELGDIARGRPMAERLIRERCREPELLEVCKRRGISI
jgi:tetratricopeptide (TPR) repeat protein